MAVRNTISWLFDKFDDTVSKYIESTKPFLWTGENDYNIK